MAFLFYFKILFLWVILSVDALVQGEVSEAFVDVLYWWVVSVY